MAQVVHRMNKILAPDQRTFIVAMDHGANFNVLPAMKDAEKVISEIASAGADAFLTSAGLFDKFPGAFKGKGVIVRVDGGVSCLGDHSTPLQTVLTPEDALRLGADAIITMSFPGSKFENHVLTELTRTVMAAHKWNLPVMAEALPRGFEKADDSRTPANITFACRQSVELGADLVKTEYTGDQESFAELTASVFAPVVILGGAKKVPERQLMQEIRDAMDAGAAGVAMGRNIWGHEAPAKYVSAISMLIHENATVDQALAELTRTIG